MEYFSWKRFKLSPPLIKELTERFRCQYWNPGALIIFSFFPSGFSFFLGGVRPFCGTLRGLFAEGPTSGRPCRYLKRRQLLLTENKKARNIISLCVSVVIFCERWSDHNVKCVGGRERRILTAFGLLGSNNPYWLFFALKVIQGGAEWNVRGV